MLRISLVVGWLVRSSRRLKFVFFPLVFSSSRAVVSEECGGSAGGEGRVLSRSWRENPEDVYRLDEHEKVCVFFFFVMEEETKRKGCV